MDIGVKRFVTSFTKSFKDDFDLIEENLSAAKEEVDREIELASEQKIDQIHTEQQIEFKKQDLQRSRQLQEAMENQEFRRQQTHALAENRELRMQKILKDEGKFTLIALST